MNRVTIVRTTTPTRLFKDDYPRAIDRHIDFFGGVRWTQYDPSEALFDDCHAAASGQRLAVNA